MKKVVFISGLVLAFTISFKGFAAEHGGQEHGGKAMHEHPAQKVKNFSAKEIKKAIQNHAKEVADKNGIFSLKDDKTEELLDLKFVKVHDPVRKLKNNRYFACTDFQVSGALEKLYDIDFWLEPKDGKLTVTQTKVHKHPELQKDKWEKHARYTFKGEEIVPIDN